MDHQAELSIEQLLPPAPRPVIGSRVLESINNMVGTVEAVNDDLRQVLVKVKPWASVLCFWHQITPVSDAAPPTPPTGV